jgi:hypothetical protein
MAVEATCPTAGSVLLTDRQGFLPVIGNRTSPNSTLQPAVPWWLQVVAPAAFQYR